MIVLELFHWKMKVSVSEPSDVIRVQQSEGQINPSSPAWQTAVFRHYTVPPPVQPQWRKQVSATNCPRTKVVGHFFGRPSLSLPSNNQVENTFRFFSISNISAHKKNYVHFFDLGVEIALWEDDTWTPAVMQLSASFLVSARLAQVAQLVH